MLNINKISKFILIFFILLSGSTFFTAPNWQEQYAKAELVKKYNDSSLNQEFFPLKNVKPGLKGIGKTIFSGNNIEQFGVEVLGVLPGTPAPSQSLIIVKLSGSNVERTGIFAGMSGSPIFVENKLVGAISYSFPFSKEPIAAVTPIEQMVAVFEENITNNATTSSNYYSLSDFVTGKSINIFGTNQQQPILIPEATANENYLPLNGYRLSPIATPLMVSGISEEILKNSSAQFEALGLHPMMGSTINNSVATKHEYFNKDSLSPGQTIVVHLAKGDFGLSAAGTVTWREGESILGFGHPFFPPGGIGNVDMPMSEGTVITVIPNLNNSFKLVVPKDPIGTINYDRSTGIKGKIGNVVPMIPVTLNITTSRGILQKYNFEVVQDVFLTPLLVNMGITGGLAATERSIGDLTLQMNGEIQVEGQPAIQMSNSSSSSLNPATSIGLAIAQPVAVLLGSGFENIKLQRIAINVTATDSRKNGVLESISVNRTQVQRGEEIELNISARSNTGKVFTERIPIKVPLDTRPGRGIFIVGDGTSLALNEQRGIQNPRNISQLVQIINKLRKNNKLYIKFVRSENGAIISNEELPSLPPSILATLDSNRNTGSYQPITVSTILEKEFTPTQFLVTGQQTLTVEIK